ncbi:hypothetical protein ACKU27_13065 [Sphingobium yanoikuyae]|jgi:hypothetical protein|uniref:hypothetical protein n=1 Tax=Sphingobium yanoikuyae TaxID=13690 RepID=UPI003B904594
MLMPVIELAIASDCLQFFPDTRASINGAANTVKISDDMIKIFMGVSPVAIVYSLQDG